MTKTNKYKSSSPSQSFITFIHAFTHTSLLPKLQRERDRQMFTSKKHKQICVSKITHINHTRRRKRKRIRPFTLPFSHHQNSIRDFSVRIGSFVVFSHFLSVFVLSSTNIHRICKNRVISSGILLFRFGWNFLK